MKTILYIIIALVVAIIAFYQFSPNLGAKINKSNFTAKNYKNEQFNNMYSTELIINERHKQSAEESWFMMMIGENEGREPSNPVKVNKLNQEEFQNIKNNNLVWFGHSTFLLKQDGKTLLFDPMFSVRPSPVPFFIKKRYNEELVINPENLPIIDAVVISHDHYDHLDYNTILKIKHKVKRFIVPMGVEQHLIHWGVKPENITTLKWYEHTNVDQVKLSLTPAQHFSGRRLVKNPTLWGGYMIEANDKKIFFSGDTGYGTHFKEIKEHFGKIDFALLEAGQYNPKWADIHMMPEHTVQAAIDLGVERFMPVHWGMFTLSTHAWTEPVEIIKTESKNNGLNLFTPEIGKPFNIFKENETNDWWK